MHGSATAAARAAAEQTWQLALIMRRGDLDLAAAMRRDDAALKREAARLAGVPVGQVTAEHLRQARLARGLAVIREGRERLGLAGRES